MDVVSISFNMKVRCVFSLDHLIEAILMSTHNNSVHLRLSKSICSNRLYGFG